MSLLNLDEIPDQPFELSRVGVTQALLALGRTPDEVAETLRAGGFRGQALCATACPIAAYLTKVFPGAAEVHVSAEAVTVSWVRDVIPPIPVTEFVRRFDTWACAYPFLDLDASAVSR